MTTEVEATSQALSGERRDFRVTEEKGELLDPEAGFASVEGQGEADIVDGHRNAKDVERGGRRRCLVEREDEAKKRNDLEYKTADKISGVRGTSKEDVVDVADNGDKEDEAEDVDEGLADGVPGINGSDCAEGHCPLGGREECPGAGVFEEDRGELEVGHENGQCPVSCPEVALEEKRGGCRNRRSSAGDDMKLREGAHADASIDAGSVVDAGGLEVINGTGLEGTSGASLTYTKATGTNAGRHAGERMKGAHSTESGVLQGGVENGGASLEVLGGGRQGRDAAMSPEGGYTEGCTLGTEIVDGTSLTTSRKTRCAGVSAQRADQRETAGKTIDDEAGLREADTMQVLVKK